MISAGVLHRLPSERATEPFALLRVLPRRRFIARYAGLSLNVTKCYHMSYSSRQSIDTSYYMQQKESACIFQKVDYIKDLGVFFDSQLTFSEHIHQKNNKAYSMLGIVKINFIHMDPRTFIPLYKALVRPHVEYANSVWSPYKKVTWKPLKKIQKKPSNL